jgi:hypothetical protein
VTTPSPGRYELTLVVDGTTVAYGWWDQPSTAETKWGDWRRQHGRDGARVILVDTADGSVVRRWPRLIPRT